jgi:hypothetical protein
MDIAGGLEANLEPIRDMAASKGRCSSSTRMRWLSWFAKTIERKARSIWQFAKATNCNLNDRTKGMFYRTESAFDLAVCKSDKLQTADMTGNRMMFRQVTSGSYDHRRRK